MVKEYRQIWTFAVCVLILGWQLDSVIQNIPDRYTIFLMNEIVKLFLVYEYDYLIYTPVQTYA